MSALLQQSQEWLEMRRNKIGASDAPVIMEVSPWKTPYQLWEEKLGIRKENAKTQAMQRGLDLEEKARTCFENKMDLIVLPQVIFHPKNHWMMASLDGMDVEQKHIVEIKCAGKEDHQMAKEGKIPEKYFPQLQHQMEVTGLDMAYYFSFDGEDGVIVEVSRNTKYINELVQNEGKFYKCMQDFLPPKLSTKDYDEKNDDVWAAAAAEWLSINRKLTDMEKKESEIRQTLISMSRKES